MIAYMLSLSICQANRPSRLGSGSLRHGRGRRRTGLRPRDLVPGTLYADEIVREINEAHAVVLILSEYADSKSLRERLRFSSENPISVLPPLPRARCTPYPRR